MASLLHAENLLTAGLENAVRKELDWIAQSDRFKVAFIQTGIKVKEIDPKKELIAFRIIQETLNNIIKHAQATEMKVNFHYEALYTTIDIEDNGVGFDSTNWQADLKGIGLANLFKRAKVIGGQLLLESVLNKGTRITLTLPLNNKI
jgi:signal transduction histidine kinase